MGVSDDEHVGMRDDEHVGMRDDEHVGMSDDEHVAMSDDERVGDAAPAADFVHLHVHSHYSLLSSALRLDAICRRAAEHGSGAVALTDDGNLFGAVGFCAAAKAAGVRPILGCDLFVSAGASTSSSPADAPPPHRLVVLAENETGWRNLTRLVSAGWLEGAPTHGGQPCVDRQRLGEHAEGLIALSGGPTGAVAAAWRAGQAERAQEEAQFLRDAFGAGSFFLELQDHGSAEERELCRFLLDLAPRIGCDVVATNDCRFLDTADFEALRALVAIGTGTTLDDPASRAYTPEHFMRSPAEMREVFREVPQALEATLAIAERCDFALETREAMMPDFPLPEGETVDSYLRDRSKAGLEERLADLTHGQRRHGREDYETRLDYELDVICGMGFPGYFLIVWDVIRHAREQGIPVGPGRGSAAGSLVAWSLRITDVDPLELDLLFERFLNPERKSLPDIDIDFCQRRREEVIRYVKEQYGADHVAQIITFGALNARSVIRDVGRVMNMTFGEVDRIAKMVPEELGVKLAKALKDSPQLAEAKASDPRIARLLEIAQSIEGLARNPGVHAAGVIIAPEPLVELAPLYRTGRAEITTQFAKDEAESVGLLKMDFLGLKTLTVLTDALASIERAGHEPVDLEALTLDDPLTYELFQGARTAGIFQFESSGMRDVLRKLRPERFDDLIALNALYRPGPLGSGMVDMYVERRHGREKVEYPHPDLEPILSPTYGVMIFQEQVMRAAVELAGFSLGEADILRKAMGKKKVEVMAAQRDLFVKGAVGRGMAETKAGEIFDLMAYFAGYGFNKSHSAAYALVAYWCAWLKAHHPAHFMAALLTSERDNTTKVVRYIAECRAIGIDVLPPDVNESDVDFTATGEREVRFGLSAIKGVGRGAVESILAARHRAGRFRSLFAFCREIDLRLNNKKVLEALVKAGAMDSLVPATLAVESGQSTEEAAAGARSTLLFNLDAAVERAQAAKADEAIGQASLFGGVEDAAPGGGTAAHGGAEGSEELEPELAVMPPWSKADRLRHEKEVLGFFVSGHPLEDHAEVLESLTSAPLALLAEHGDATVSVAGIVTAMRRTRTKKGDWMAFFTLEDMSGGCEVVVFPRTWAECERDVEVDATLCVKGRVEVDGERSKVLAEAVRPLGEAERDAVKGLLLRLPEGLAAAELEERLARADDLLVAAPGTVPVTFELTVPDLGRVRVKAGARFRVAPEAELVAQLEAVVGEGRVKTVV